MNCKECGFNLAEMVLEPDEEVLKVKGIYCPRCFMVAMSKRAASFAELRLEVSHAR